MSMSTLGAYFRLARVGWVLVREGVVLALPSDDLPAPAQVLKALLKPFARSKAKRAQRSDRLAVAVERLGPSYVKMGQFLATRPDVVGAEFADDLASLQDRMAFFPAAAAKANIEGSLGRPVSELYREFGDPIAAASIVAKVSRDRYMQDVHARHPQYGFEQHKGYGTPAHLAALREHGPCVEHRRSFAPVRECLDLAQAAAIA